MALIHPTATVSPEAELADSVEIGPYCVLTGHVRLAAGVRLVGNNYLSGPVRIGEGTILYPFSCVGFPPQDVKFKLADKTAGVVIGRDCILREHATIHSASNDHTPTTVGDRLFLMVNAHLAHDCKIGSDVVMVNNSAVGGHGQVHDRAILAGGALIHQHCRVGRMAMVAGGNAVSADVPPYCIADERNRIRGINRIGLRRSGTPREHINAVDSAFRDLLRSPMPRDEMIAELDRRAVSCPPVADLARFIKESKRICPGHGKMPRLLTTWLMRLRKGETSLAGLGDTFDED